MELSRRYFVSRGHHYERAPVGRMELTPELEDLIKKGERFELAAYIHPTSEGPKILGLSLMPIEAVPTQPKGE